MMPDMDGYEVARRLRAEPTTNDIPIIMFTAKTMVDDKVAGFEAGADDYLTKPTHPAELASRVKAVLVRSQQRKASGQATGASSGLSVAFLGVKGGVGTTTLAANIASMLAQQQDTILTDLRPGQGSLGVSLGIGRGQGMATVMSRSPNEITAQAVEDQLVSHQTGMKLLLSSVRPQESQLNITPEHFAALLSAMASLSHFRVIDAGAGVNRLSVRIMREVAHTVLLVEPNRVTLTLATEMMREIEALSLGPQRVSVVVFNRAQSSLQVPWQEVEQILNHEVAAIISPAPELAFQAAEAGFPIAHFQPSSIVAGQMTKLAEELAKRSS